MERRPMKLYLVRHAEYGETTANGRCKYDAIIATGKHRAMTAQQRRKRRMIRRFAPTVALCAVIAIIAAACVCALARPVERDTQPEAASTETVAAATKIAPAITKAAEQITKTPETITPEAPEETEPEEQPEEAPEEISRYAGSACMARSARRTVRRASCRCPDCAEPLFVAGIPGYGRRGRFPKVRGRLAIQPRAVSLDSRTDTDAVRRSLYRAARHRLHSSRRSGIFQHKGIQRQYRCSHRKSHLLFY